MLSSLLWRSQVATRPADSFGLHRVGAYLRLMNKAALSAPQGPVLESGTGCGNALNRHARFASGTRSRRRASRQGGRLRIGHAHFPLNGGSGTEPSVAGNGHGRVGDNVACALHGVDTGQYCSLGLKNALHERAGFRCRVEKVGGSFDAKCARREITGEMPRLLGRFFVRRSIY
jgi:hypothetical protein